MRRVKLKKWTEEERIKTGLRPQKREKRGKERKESTERKVEWGWGIMRGFKQGIKERNREKGKQ